MLFCPTFFVVNPSCSSSHSVDLPGRSMPGEERSASQSAARRCSPSHARFPTNQKQNIKKKYHVLKYI